MRFENRSTTPALRLQPGPGVVTRMPAILAITHQLQMAKVADQVLVLQDGAVKDADLA